MSESLRQLTLNKLNTSLKTTLFIFSMGFESNMMNPKELP